MWVIGGQSKKKQSITGDSFFEVSLLIDTKKGNTYRVNLASDKCFLEWFLISWPSNVFTLRLLTSERENAIYTKAEEAS